MLFTKLLLSPLPHARVRSVDASEALKMPGVFAVIGADDLNAAAPPERGVAAEEEEGPEGGKADKPKRIDPELGLTNEPVYQGQPVLAVAAVDEVTAANAIERIKIAWEPLPFCVDAIQSLHPNGPDARTEGNVHFGDGLKHYKWTAEDWKEVEAGRLPMRDAPDKWQYGDVDAALKEAAVVIDETIMCQSTSHQCMEPRTSMAYWQNGKLYLHASAQTTAHIARSVGRWSGAGPTEVVLFGEYVGGGFGGKNPETHMHTAIPAVLAKKTGRPVQMRITREEDNYIGRSRAGLHMRVRMGFRKDGRMTALDMFVVQNNGPFARAGDYNTCGVVASATYTPLSMRFRGTAVMTNTPPHGPQRGPGGTQSNVMFEPLITQGRAQARHRRSGDSQDQRARDRIEVRPARCERAAEFPDRRLHARGARSGRRRIQLERAEAAQRRAARQQSDGCGGRDWRVHGRHHRIRRAGDDRARRQVVHPAGCWQHRHAVGARHRARGCRSAGHALGPVRDHLGRHVQTPAVELPSGRQSDDSRQLARELGGGTGCREEAAGDCRQGPRRQPGRLRSGWRACLSPWQSRTRAVVRAGRQARHRARREIRRPRAAQRHQRDDDGIGDGDCRTSD